MLSQVCVLSAIFCLVVSQAPTPMDPNFSGGSFGQPGFQDPNMFAGQSFQPGSMPAPLPLQRPSPMQSFLPYLMFRGSDMAQMAAMMHMFGGMGGGGGGGGLISSPLLMMSMLGAM